MTFEELAPSAMNPIERRKSWREKKMSKYNNYELFFIVPERGRSSLETALGLNYLRNDFIGPK